MVEMGEHAAPLCKVQAPDFTRDPETEAPSHIARVSSQPVVSTPWETQLLNKHRQQGRQK